MSNLSRWMPCTSFVKLSQTDSRQSATTIFRYTRSIESTSPSKLDRRATGSRRRRSDSVFKVFTETFTTLKAYTRKHYGVSIHQRLASPVTKSTTPRTHINLCTELGIIVIFDESELVPTQRLLHLEIDWNFTNCQVWPPFDAGTKLQYLLKLLIKTQRAPLAQLESIRGKICWMKKVVIFNRINFRFFQALVTKHPKQGRHPR